MRHRPMMLIALVLSLAATAVAQADQTDDYIKAEMLRQHIPGLSLAVVKDGKIVKAAGYGFANLKLEIPATPETVYKVGSVGKQFIATGIMLLVQEGKLGVDDPVGRVSRGNTAGVERHHDPAPADAHLRPRLRASRLRPFQDSE